MLTLLERLADQNLIVLQKSNLNTIDQIAAGVSAIVPIGLVFNSVQGKEGDTMNVATGKYNDMIDTKIAEIKSECEIK